MTENTHQMTTRGRVSKRPGLDDKKIQALGKIRALKEGAVNPLDQY